jgi:hypothetical protein
MFPISFERLTGDAGKEMPKTNLGNFCEKGIRFGQSSGIE